ncbi:molybdenum cofactor sulfurase isoform X2 [Leptinotarsa decemlineata]|uniref:molybdenum cofactor sulfurase isoform X2 n=1 Tax=Leptinotarsa decemlineata TaxID=7539 RepID=UPI003D30B5BA
MEDFLTYEPVYSNEQFNLIGQEFTRMKDSVYLDHAGATLYSEKQIKNIFNDLSTSVYSNPHSLHTSSKSTEDAVDVIRYQFEDGTLSFLSILSIKHGFDTIRRLKLNFDIISKHTFSLARYVYRNLISLHHSNGKPVSILYHDTTFEDPNFQGGKVNFTLLRPNGEHVGYSEVLHMANLHGIHLRTGCHCNPGACQRFLKLKPNDVLKHFSSGHVCGDQNDLIDGYPTGTIRLSFGYMSTKEDCDTFLKMIESCFVSHPIIRKMPSHWNQLEDRSRKLFYSNGKKLTDKKVDIVFPITPETVHDKNNPYRDIRGSLEHIFLYPIKSCGAYQVARNWIITPKGLKYDREWMIINSAGICLTQKQNKKLCLLKPVIDLKKNLLVLQFKGYPNIEIDLNDSTNKKEAHLCQSKICREQVVGWDCGDEVSEWLSKALAMHGLRLLRQYEDEDSSTQLSFANKAQYLMLNSKSVEWLRRHVSEGNLNESLKSTIQRFRPNFVVNFEEAFEENELSEFLIGDVQFKSLGKCTRCQMICIDQETGCISKEPLLTLSREFKGKINFGIYVNQVNAERESDVEMKSIIVANHANERL